MTMMISACAAASAGEAQALQPAALSGASDSGRRPKTNMVWPAFLRLRVIGLPMMPRPINATFIVFLPWPYVGLVSLVQDLRQPQAELRPQIQHRHGDHLDPHEGQHAGEDLAQADMRRCHALEVERGHRHGG